MDNFVCSFFGHSDVEITDELTEKTTKEIEQVIVEGCRTFYFGGYSDFDSLCYTIVTHIKEQKPELDLKRIYCVSQERYLRKKVRYFNRDDYDDVVYLMPAFEGWYKSIYYRNCAMIDNSDYVIFYCEEKPESGAYKAYKYAVKAKKKIVNLF